MYTVDDERYARAQEVELEWWTNNAWTPHVSWNQYDRDFFEHYGLKRWDTAVDVGSGPVPILCNHNVIYRRGISVDPLNYQYAKIPKYTRYLTKPFETVLSTGQLDDGVADIVFCMNVLDHVQDPAKLILELSRISKRPNSRLVLYVDLDRDPDPAHPFRFERDWLASQLLPEFEPIMWMEKKSWKWPNQVLCFVGRAR